MPAAVLFDLDGTLMDTLEDIASSANTVLAHLGFPQHEMEAYKYFVGDGIEALATRILPNSERDATTIARVVTCIDREYSQHWADTTHPYQGIPELLQALTVRGIKMAVLSNKPNDPTKTMVSKLLPHWRFDIVLGARPCVPKKPDPAAALEIADKLKELKDTIGPDDETGSGEGGKEPPASIEVEKGETEVEIKGSVGQPTSDTPKTAGDPYD